LPRWQRGPPGLGSAIRTAASNLSLGHYGPVMITGFLAYGVAQMLFAVGLWRACRMSRPGRIGAGAVGAAGAAFVIAGVFVTDPRDGTVVTLHGALHVGAALVIFFAAWPVAMLAFARLFIAERGVAVMSAVAGSRSRRCSWPPSRPPACSACWSGS
jgi:hypothetical protein